MYVFTKELETKRFKAVAGMPLPARLDTVHGRRFLKTAYGADIIKEVDYRRPEDFLALIAADSDTQVREKFAKLKILCDSQARTIRDLEQENGRLKKQLRRDGANP